MRFFIAVALSLCVASTSFGDLVISYSAVPEAGNEVSNPPYSAHAAVSGDSLSAGSGLTPVAGSAFWNFKDWSGTDFSTSLAANDYWQWGFDVIGSVALDLTTIDIRLATRDGGPPDAKVQAAINGGAAVDVLTASGITTGGAVYSANLSLLPTLGLGDSIVFSLAGWSDQALGSLTLENANGAGTAIIINGNFSPAAIPEPGATWLGVVVCGLAATAGVLRLTRTRRRARR